MTKQAEPSAWSTRPAFRPRQMLTAEALNAGFDDELQRQQLLNRAVFGYGVALGFGVVTRDDDTLDLDGCGRLCVTRGLALDRHGRMLSWPGGRVGLSDVVGKRPEAEGWYTLIAHYAARVPPDDDCPPCGADRPRWRKDGVVFSLRPGCRAVDRDCATHPPGSCLSHEHYLCRRTGAIPGEDPRTVAVDDDVDWLDAKRDPLCAIGCDGWQYDSDPEVGVPIACVEIENRAAPGCDPCFEIATTDLIRCRVRPYVYRNPLLYELIRGCDVQATRIAEISWKNWVAPGWEQKVRWPEFADRIASGLTVTFTRPIRTATIHHSSVFVTALTQEYNTDYWVGQRVPLRLQMLGGGPDLARSVRLVPEPDWLAAEVRGSRSTLFAGSRFEVTLRGQLLRDECKRMLDARPPDIEDDVRGQDRPGGDFVSAFQVAPRT